MRHVKQPVGSWIPWAVRGGLALGLACGCHATSASALPVEAIEPLAAGQADPRAGRTHLERVPMASGPDMVVAVTLPERYRRGDRHPTILSMAPGGQDYEAVQVSLESFWEAEAILRGVVVLTPVAPNGHPLYADAAAAVPELLGHLLQRYPAVPHQVHLVGYSFGGAAAFAVAFSRPELFDSLTVLAGAPLRTATTAQLVGLAPLKIALYVGDKDRSWKRSLNRLTAELSAVGVHARYEILPGETHQLESLRGPGARALFDRLSL